MSRLVTLLVGLLVAGCASSGSPVASNTVGARLWTQLEGDGGLTVVFESGGGDAATVWDEITPQVRRLGNVRTFVYDRAGLGQSAPATTPYTIDGEAEALIAALDRAGVNGDIVLVAHSYGGFVSTLVAERDPRVVGLVLIDANLPGSLSDETVSGFLAVYRPQYDELRQARPAFARTMIPLLEAYPATARRMRSASVPLTLPVIDIVAESSWGDTVEEDASLHRAHEAFVAESETREPVFVEGSGHYVMRDRPDVVVDAIARMVARVRSQP